MASERLLHVLKSLRRRLIWIDGTAGLGWSLLAALACLLAGVWLDLLLELSPQMRVAALFAACVMAVVLLVAMIWRAFHRSLLARIATIVDSVGQTGGQVRSGIDLVHFDPRTMQTVNRDLTAGLCSMAVERAARLAETVPPSKAVPAKPVSRSFGTFGLLAVLTVALVLLLPRVAHTQWLRFADPFGDHPPFTMITFEVEPKGARVIYGQGLDIRATLTGPSVDTAELVLRPTDESAGQNADLEVLPMFPEANGTWRATLSKITAPLTFHVRAGRARSTNYNVDVITVPNIEDVTFRMVHPPYTRQAVYEGPLPERGLAGLLGTRVEIRARSNRPLEGGHCEYVTADGSERVELRPVPTAPEQVTGAFAINGDGHIEFTVTDSAGQQSTDTYAAPVVLMEDQRPFVRLMQPRAISFATPTARIPVVIAAEDDYGLSRAELFRSLNDSRYLPMQIPIPSEEPRRVYETLHLPLDAYGLQAGDEIKLFVRVEDNDPGPAGQENTEQRGKGAESSVVVIRIIAQNVFERMQRTRDGMQLLMSKYQEAQRRMESLASEIEKLKDSLEDLPADSPLAEQQRDQLQQLSEQMQAEADRLQELSKTLLPYELDKELTKQLERLAQSLSKMTEQAARLNQQQEMTQRELSEQLDQMLDEIKDEQEQLDDEAMQPLEMLAKVYPLFEDQARFVQLYMRQRDLEDRLSSLHGKDGQDDPALKARMRDLEDEQRQVRRELLGLLDDIENHVAQLPDDEAVEELKTSAAEFIEAVRQSGAIDEMVEAEGGLAEFSGTNGHEASKRAADILEQFLSKSEGMGNVAGKAALRFQPGLGGAMGQTMNQLLAGSGLGQNMPGTGRGTGAGGGYSARRSTLQNVGIYGGMPGMESGGGGAENQDQTSGGVGFASSGQGGAEGTGRSFNSGSTLSPSGTTEAAVPLQYRRKVAEYFQRIADEVGVDQPAN